MSRLTVYISLLILAFGLPSLSVGDDRLIWRGCGISKHAFMSACAAEYQKQTGIKIEITGGGAQFGIESTGAGSANLGGTCRECLNKLREDQLGLQLELVAWDALCIVVHPDNPVENISKQQLIDVMKQRIINWKELGGNDERIVVAVRRGSTSGVGYCARKLILGDPEASFGRGVIRLNSTGPLEQLIEEQNRAIGISGVSSARKRNVKMLAIGGIEPTQELIADGSYPFYRPLYIAWKPGTSRDQQQARRFIDWLTSDAGQEVIESQGTVSIRQGAVLVKAFQHFEHPERISNYQALVERADGLRVAGP